MFAPPGWANPTTPSFAGVQCGNVSQTVTYTTSGTAPKPIGFTDQASWSDRTSFTTSDTIAWNCQTTGIYNLRFNQTLGVTASVPVPDSQIIVIPNTVFFLDVSGTLIAPQVGSAILHPLTSTGATVTHTAADVESDILMTTFTTSPGSLTAISIPGGTWNLSLFASTTDGTEANSAYINVYTVDADGVSNPVLIQNNSGSPFIVNGSDTYNYNVPFTVPTFTVANLTKRVQFKIFANFGLASSMTFFFRDLALSSVYTTISQDVVPPIIDTVDARITVISTTSEFNQVFASSIPITAIYGTSTTYSTSVNAIANVYKGDQVRCTIAAIQGKVVVTSGQTTLPAPANTLQWNLIAQGTYGNPDIILAPPMLLRSMRRHLVTTAEVDTETLITSTTEISPLVLKMRKDALENPELI